MKEFIAVIGQSACGKTTFVQNEFIGANEMVLNKDPLLHTVVNDCCLLGDYVTSVRTKGTDRFSYSILPDLIEFIKNKKDEYNRFVAEGDRINCERFFQSLKDLKLNVTVYVFLCDVNLSVQRRVDSGSKPSEQFVRATQTKTLRMKKMVESLGFKVIVEDSRTENNIKHGWW